MARILVVEDEVVAALSIQAFLENSEHVVVARVTSGSEAVLVAAELQPNLVLMDIYLEGEIDGITAATQIWNQLSIPVMYLTAQVEDQTLQRAIEMEPFGYLIKPFNRVELLTAMNIALRRHQLEQQLEQAEQWLTTILTSIEDGTIVTDQNGRITFMNPVAESLTGWQRSEALGEFAEQVLHLIHAETRETIENPLLRAMREGMSVSLPDQCLLQTKDGLERTIGDTAAPIRNDKGEITGSVLIFQDITARKREEELLHRREQEFRALVENSPDLVVRFDRAFHHIYVNPVVERVTGIPRQVFIGRTNRELGMPPSLVTYWSATLQSVWATGQEQTIEFEFPALDGLKFYQARVTPEFARNGSIESLLCVTRDVTEYKQAAAALQQQAERERLLSAIAQRIRQSLNLDEILNTTVTEVRHLLHTDRVVLYRFEPDWSGFVSVESVSAGWTPMLGHRIFDPCLVQEQCLNPYKQGYINSTQDIHTAGLADCYVDLLDRFQVQANLVIPVLLGDQLWGLMAVQQCVSPRQWQDWEIDLLRHLSAQVAIAIQQSQLYQQTQQQAQREQALNRVIQTIRNSLDLSTIFDTAAAEISRLLQVDQVRICRYFPEQAVWRNWANYSQQPEALPAYPGLEVPDADDSIYACLKRLEVVRVDDTSTVEGELNQNLAQTFPGAWLLLPLQVGMTVWGCITLIKSPQPFVWQDWQVDLLQSVADQLAIAIQQSELYQQVQQLNAQLEVQVQERSALLRQASSFEATLKRITDRVRDSLDEDHILQAVVEELTHAIRVSICSVALYNLPQQTVEVRYEYNTELSLLQNRVIPMANFPEIYQQLLDGQHFQFCNFSVDATQRRSVRLACPIFDDQGVLGDLRLVHHAEHVFSEQEVRLVQQVANQCAIALRQSRLYQTAQAQVEELERLNHLKDDFLSTVSHELRTPISSIKMAVQMLEITLFREGGMRSNDPASARITQYLKILRDESQREANLINDLLDLSRLESNAEPLSFSTMDLQTWLLQLIEPFIEQARSQQQTLEFNLLELPSPMTTDFSHLERILVELLENACKYTPSGETITLLAQPFEGNLLLSVSNSGVEISASELERVFDKFYRVLSRDPWQYSGTGLGLALVKKLVEQLQGTVEASSKNRQTTFTIQIPIITNNL